MPARIHRIEFDRDEGVTVETGDGVTVEVLPYAVWRADNSGGHPPELIDASEDGAVRLGPWVVAVSRRIAP